MKASYVPVLGILDHVIVNKETKTKEEKTVIAWSKIY